MIEQTYVSISLQDLDRLWDARGHPVSYDILLRIIGDTDKTLVESEAENIYESLYCRE